MGEYRTGALGALLPSDAPDTMQRFARYWLDQRSGRAPPRFSDIDPTEIPWALPNIFVLQRRASDGLFVYQLVGDLMAQMLGGGLKGKSALDVFEPSYGRWTQDRWDRVSAEQAACYLHTQHVTAENILRNAKRVLFPLIQEPDKEERLVGIAVFKTVDLTVAHTMREQPEAEVIWTPIAELPE